MEKPKMGQELPNETGDFAKNKNQRKDKRFKHNWRIDMLAVPKGHEEELELFKMSKLDRHLFLEQKSKTNLEAKKSKKKIPLEQNPERMKRIKEMSVTSPRFYLLQKKMYTKSLGKNFEKKMDVKFKEAYQSPYNEYQRAKEELKKKKKGKPTKGGKPKGGKAKGQKGKGKDAKSSEKATKKKKSKKELIAEAVEYCKKMAIPKRVFKPPKIDRGKIVDLNAIAVNMAKMAKSKPYFGSSLQVRDFTKISPTALHYFPTDRIRELAIIPEVRRVEIIPKIPGQVAENALHAIASPRILELAKKREKAGPKEADVNENAFKISPNALRYVATARIKELAKPREYE